MNQDQFWALITNAKATAQPNADSIAEAATAILARLPAQEIAQAAQPFWDLMSKSYRTDLWAAAYLINGGASDDGFDYFRGWLISRGQDTFNQAVSDPDSLANHPAVQAAAQNGEDLDGEPMLSIAWSAYHQKTGDQLPPGSFTINYPPLTHDWDFEDKEEMTRRLPQLSRLYYT